jgi:hypothetical protein
MPSAHSNAKTVVASVWTGGAAVWTSGPAIWTGGALGRWRANSARKSPAIGGTDDSNTEA